MLKVFILIAFAFNLAFAGSRFSDAEKQKFMNEVSKTISKIKVKNKGVIDLVSTKPIMNEVLDSFVEIQKITKDESEKIKKDYESIVSDSKLKPENSEEMLNKFIKNEFDELNKSVLPKTAEGMICNKSVCDTGLQCAIAPTQEAGPKCKSFNNECKDDKDCCSSSCKLNTSLKKKMCEAVAKCFKPIALGQSCLNNPVCEVGICDHFDAKTLGIGECENKGASCKKNSDCCSNACKSNKCEIAVICKDCIRNGNKAEKGKKCCEGLYKNDKDICIPDLPPSVIPQVKNNPLKKIINIFAEFIIPSASADDLAALAAAATQADAAATAANLAATQAGAAVEVAIQAYQDALENGFPPQQARTHIALIKAKALLVKAVTAASVAETKSKAANAALAAAGGSTGGSTGGTGGPKSAEAIAANAVVVNITKKSEFKTCDIHLKEDFYNYLKNYSYKDGIKDEKVNLLNLNIALLSFDYVMLGESVNDYRSINGQLKDIALLDQQQRQKTNVKFDEMNLKLKCICLDVKGYKAITNPADKTLFETKCTDEYQHFLTDAQLTSDPGVQGGDASGLKAKKLLVAWSKLMQDFNMKLSTDNTEVFTKLADLRDWSIKQADATQPTGWGAGVYKEDTTPLYHYTIKKIGWLAGLFVFIITAGIGFIFYVLGAGTTSSAFLTAIGLLTSGYATFWVADSLKGAWQTQPPSLHDNITEHHDCGFWDLYSCEEHDVYLIHSSNSVCNINAYANACIKNFMAVYPDPTSTSGQAQYIIDPWVPKNVNKNLLIKNIYPGKNYAESLESAFQVGKAYVTNGTENPRLNANSFASFGIRFSSPEDFVLNKTIIAEIKAKAKKFAVDELFFDSTEIENLNAFADYTYEYHFLRPKLSKTGEISYPLVGLLPYLEFMSNGVAGSIGVGSGHAAVTFGNLHTNYSLDYLNTAAIFIDKPIIQEESQKVQIDLDNQKTLSALANNPLFDSQLTKLNPDMIKAAAKSVGAKGDVTLSGDQKKYLNAIGTLRAARKSQLKNLEAYNKAIASNGDSDRASRVASASKNYASSFGSPLSKSSSSGNTSQSLFGSGGIDGLKTTELKKSDTSQNKNENYNTFNSGAASTSNKTTAEKPVVNSAADEDARRLAEAIEARNKANKDKYKTDDAQTIFEQVTNAYIRNYDKVLTKKKDKDALEQK